MPRRNLGLQAAWLADSVSDDDAAEVAAGADHGPSAPSPRFNAFELAPDAPSRSFFGGRARRPDAFGSVDRASARASVAALLSRARILDELDRALVEMVLGRGVSIAVAAAWGCRSQTTVRRRLARALRRLASLEVTWLCAIGDLDAPRSRVGVMRFGQGHSLRAIAARLGLKLHQVREECRLVSESAAAWRRSRQRSLKEDAA